MSLIVWLPLTKDLRQQGLSNIKVENHNATLNTAGKLGSCYYFNGGQQWLQFDTVLGDYYNNDWSIACWLKPTDSTRSVIISEYSSTGASNVGLELTASRVVRLYWNGSPDINFTTAGALLINEWTHLTVTKQARVVKVYFNGELKQTYTNSSDFSTRTSASYPRIGDDYRGNSSSTVSYQGYINDFRMYDHCLSPMEVKQISQGLVLHYPLNRNGWGQENLLVKSGVFSSTSGWANNQNVTLSTRDNELKAVINQTDSTPGIKATNAFNLTAGTYTASLLIKVENGNKNFVNYPFYINNGTALYNGVYTKKENRGDYVYEEATFTLTSNANNIICYILTSSPANGETWYIKWIKLEKGSKATPWCPNSSDVLATTMDLNSTTEYDCSGFGNNGTRTGTFTWSSDTPKYQVSTYFVDYTRKLRAPFVLTPTAITMAVWIKSSTSGKGSYHMPLNIDGAHYEFSIGSDGKFRNGFYINNLRKVDTTNSKNVLDGQWHHLCATFDGTTIKRYVDGLSVIDGDHAASGTLQTTASIYVGDYGTNESYGNAQIYESDIRIYATALSADDVRALYENSAYIANNGTTYAYEFIEE